MAININQKIEGKKLILEIDLSKRHAPSKSGKNIIIATTNGNADVGKDGIKFGLNVYAPAPAKE